MAEMSNLDTCSGVTSVYFHNGRDDNLLGKITVPMTIMIRVVGFLENF